jgi:hypothetical protein
LGFRRSFGKDIGSSTKDSLIIICFEADLHLGRVTR